MAGDKETLCFVRDCECVLYFLESCRQTEWAIADKVSSRDVGKSLSPNPKFESLVPSPKARVPIKNELFSSGKWVGSELQVQSESLKVKPKSSPSQATGVT